MTAPAFLRRCLCAAAALGVAGLLLWPREYLPNA